MQAGGRRRRGARAAGAGGGAVPVLARAAARARAAGRLGEMAAASLWAETEAILGDVERLCAEAEDCEGVERCEALARDAARAHGEGAADAAALIRAVAGRVDAARARAEELAARTPSSPEIEALEHERVALQNRIAGQRGEADKVDELVAALERKVADLEAELARRRAAADEQLPLMKHSLSLFACVSKIKWDFQHRDNERIAGTVVDAESGRAKQFAVELDGKSPFEVANLLWGYVGVP